MDIHFVANSTLCWECANATGNCSWSEDLIPVEGWVAEYSTKTKEDSYRVIACPEFVRDSYQNGQVRMKK